MAIFVTIRSLEQALEEIQEETSLFHTDAKNTDAVKRRRLQRVMKMESLEKQVVELKNGTTDEKPIIFITDEKSIIFITDEKSIIFPYYDERQ